MPENLPVTASEADITDEMEKGGPALGAFLKATGIAIADSQKALDEAFRETAKVLSNQQIDVIAVFEQQVDDDGQMQAGIPKIQKLPLINYVMPVGYEFQRVYLEAEMDVEEFNAVKGMNLRGKSTNLRMTAGFQAGLFGASGGASTSLGHSDFSRSTNSSSSTDKAAGSLHLEATITPRDEIALPSPLIIQKGPKLALRLMSRRNMNGSDPGGGAPIPVIGREANFKITLKKIDGSFNDGKDVDINVSDPLVILEAANMTTDSNGEINFTIKREWGILGEGEAAPNPTDVVVRVTFGVVVDSASVVL